MEKKTDNANIKHKEYECIAAFIKVDPKEPNSPYKGNALFIPKGYRGNEYKFTSACFSSCDYQSVLTMLISAIVNADPKADLKALFEESERVLKEEQAGKDDDEITVE